MFLFLINDHKNQMCKLVKTLLSNCRSNHRLPGLTLTLRILSTVSCCKKRLVHVRIHNPVGKIFVNVVISLNVKVLTGFGFKFFSKSAAKSAKHCHSREDFVQDE